MPIKTGTISVPVYLCQFHTVKYSEFFLELVNGYQEPIYTKHSMKYLKIVIKKAGLWFPRKLCLSEEDRQARK